MKTDQLHPSVYIEMWALSPWGQNPLTFKMPSASHRRPWHRPYYIVRHFDFMFYVWWKIFARLSGAWFARCQLGSWLWVWLNAWPRALVWWDPHEVNNWTWEMFSTALVPGKGSVGTRHHFRWQSYFSPLGHYGTTHLYHTSSSMFHIKYFPPRRTDGAGRCLDWRSWF